MTSQADLGWDVVEPSRGEAVCLCRWVGRGGWVRLAL